MDRRQLLRTGAAAVALAAAGPRPSSAANVDAPFSIDASFAKFLQEIGGWRRPMPAEPSSSPGADPIVRSHFPDWRVHGDPGDGGRALRAAAIWRDRTGQSGAGR